MTDVLIIGGGVIGLSLAWDLACHGQTVHVIDQGEPGKEASWAGAGILPPASWKGAQHPYDQLRALSSELHPQWAEKLHEETGIDTGYRNCGGIYLARSPGEAASLTAWADAAKEEGIDVQRMSDRGLEDAGVGSQEPRILAGYFLSQEAQLRNPHHLQALRVACERRGVRISPHLEAAGFEVAGGQVKAVITADGPRQAEKYCFTSGAWTGRLAHKLGLAIGVLPIRGQMVLFGACGFSATGDQAVSRGQAAPQPLFPHILGEGSRYLVPRDDGRVLAGSTEEEVGFDKRTTEEAIADLVAFGRGLVPALAGAPIENAWAGLRPASFDGLPYLGPLPGFDNCFIASGHFRSGLYLSPATAVVVGQMLRGELPRIDLSPFSVIRSS